MMQSCGQQTRDLMDETQLTFKPLGPSKSSWLKDKKVLFLKNYNPPTNTKQKSPQPQAQTLISTDRNTSPNTGHLASADHRHNRRENRRVASLDEGNNDQSQVTSSMNTIGPQPPVNTTIIGHYELKKTLGKGNFSTVKLAQHRITNHSVAIKVVKISVLSEDNLMKVNREIDVLKKLGKHDHIVRLYQVIKTKRYFMLVTEYCANGELYDYLVDKGKLSEPQSCDFFLQILSAIEYLHDHNVVHRDLKAENLLLTNDFKTIKIADFGFANYYKRDKLLSTWCGSPPYAAPELFKGLQYVGPPVDIWSLGVILYVLVCGSLPFDGHNLVYLKSRVLSGRFRIPFFMSTECEALIRGMLRLDPERRFVIRQIRSHAWTQKYGKSSSYLVQSHSNDHFKSPKVYKPIESRNARDLKAKSIECDEDSKSNSNSGNNRGQSLDLEEDKKKPVESAVNEDASMVCLTGSNDGVKTAQSRPSQSEVAKSLKIHNLVNTEIANAVSNMSIDSNNSSISVSHGNDASNAMSIQSVSQSGSTRPAVSRAESVPSREFGKQDSIDDQIIEFMVENLKLAESQKMIKQSIDDDKYDDLHAVYRLIKDQPNILMNSQAKFKVPSSSFNAPQFKEIPKKPSITAGYVHNPCGIEAAQAGGLPHSSPQREANIVSTESAHEKPKPDSRGSDERIPVDRSQNAAIDLITHQDQRDKFSPALLTTIRHRKSDDQSWQTPPQLFLTPPVESRVQTSNPSEQGSQVKSDQKQADFEVAQTIPPDVKTATARHSFDSTMQRLQSCLQNFADPQYDKLNLANTNRDFTWDSSILDTLGTSTSLLSGSDASSQATGAAQAVAYAGVMAREGKQSELAGITTNLLQIGQDLQNTVSPLTPSVPKNQDLLLAQLSAPSPCAANFTQSGLFLNENQSDPRCQQVAPVQFMPNNLVNQNLAALANFPLQNTLNIPGMLNLNLLDPNGLASGMERRASDGQASYSSLTCDKANNNQQQMSTPQHQNSNVADPQTTATTYSQQPAMSFLSSSSYQLSNPQLQPQQLHYYQDQQIGKDSVAQSHDLATCFIEQSADKNSSNNSSLYSGDLTNSQDSSSRQIMRNKTSVEQQTPTQLNPLDLSKGSRDSGGVNLSSTSGGFDHSCENRPSAQSLNQRSNSTTSASIVFHSPIMASHTTSPRSSSIVSSGAANNNIQIPFCQVSPSSLSLSGGGPGHLLNRRKRHSLDTESRAYSSQHQHQNPSTHQSPKCRLVQSNLHDLNRLQHRNNQYQFLQYPANSHLGQLRNFAQTFSFKSLKIRQATGTNTGTTPPAATTSPLNQSPASQIPISMDVNPQEDKDLRKNINLFSDPR